MHAIRSRLRPRSAGLPTARRDTLLAAAFLALVLLVFFHTALPRGRVLSPAGIIFDTPVFASSTPDPKPGGNALLFDQVYQFTPWRSFAREELLAGRLPLWNPYSSSGTPLVATLQSAVFYPINLALLVVEFERAFLWSAFLRLWLAGFGTYLLARRYWLELLPALIAALAFMFSTFLVAWLGHPHANVAICLPWLVLFMEQLTNAASRRGRLRASAALAITTAAVLTGGHAETALHVLLTACVYAAARWIQMRSEISSPALLRRGGLMGIGLTLGAGIAAVQLLPFLEWLPLSEEYGTRGGRECDPLSLGFVRELPSLLAGVFPNAYGNPTWAGSYWSFNPWSSYNEGALYVGAIPLALAVTALLTGWADPFVRVWAAIGGLALAMALRLPGFDALQHLPLLELANSGRLRLIVAFSVALLSGFGAQALVAEPARRSARRGLAVSLSAVAGLGAVLLLAGRVVLPGYDAQIGDYVQRHIARTVAHGDTLPRSMAICDGRVASCLSDIERAYSPGNVELYLPALVAAAALVVLRFGRRRVLLSALLVLTAVELVGTGSDYNPTIARDDFYPTPRLMAQSAELQGNGRVVFLQQTMYPDAQLLFGVREARGLDYPLRWYSQYLNATEDRIPWIDNGALIRTVNSPLTRALAVDYVVTTAGELPWAGPNLVEVARDGELVLARVPEPTRRGRLISSAIIAADDEEALEILGSDPDAISQRAVLSDTPAARALVASLTNGVVVAAEAELLRDEPRRQVWQVTSSVPALLVVADTYYPGWRATIDGESAAIMRANLAFRAVLVPPGEHVIEFRYEPRSVRIGLWISSVSLLIVLGLLIAGWLPPRRRIMPRL
jgi:hypothetical protein